MIGQSLGAREVGHCERGPEDDVITVDRTLLLDPLGDGALTRVLVRIGPGWETFVLVELSQPHVFRPNPARFEIDDPSAAIIVGSSGMCSW